LPEEVPWQRLSQTTAATLLVIAAPLSEGYKIEEISTQLGLKTTYVRTLLSEAASELEQMAD